MPDANVDAGFIGSVISSLPLDSMISAPLQAMIKAQTQAAKSYTDFLLSVCIKDGKAVSVQFDYEETLVDEKGVTTADTDQSHAYSSARGSRASHHLYRRRDYRLRA